MGAGRPVDIETAFDNAWNKAAAESFYQHIEELPLSRHGYRSLVVDPEIQRCSGVRQPEPVYFGPVHPVTISTHQDQQELSRLEAGNNSRAGLSMANHRTVSCDVTPTIKTGNPHIWEQAAKCSMYRPKPSKCRISSRNELDALVKSHPLPALPTEHVWRSTFSYYMRLWILVVLANIAALAIRIESLARSPTAFTYGDAATATGANLFLAAITRHEHCINLIFRLACALPLRSPLWLRRRAAKVYSYGGIHSGCGISALLWYVCYTILAARQFAGSYAEKIALATTTGSTLMLLVLIIVASHPRIRRCHHNKWEISHRFGSWTAVALVWAQTLIIVITTAQNTSEHVGVALATTPAFYFLILITLLLIYPWLRLRRRKITKSEQLSPHALRLHFNDRSLPPCKGYRLATNPLFEYHGFATIPNSPCSEEKGYSILVSDAGDWTHDLITNPPRTVWTRGAPTTGVMRIATLFAPLIVVATGSGIGPCLSFLQPRPRWPVRIIWSCRSPEATYGRDILSAVLRSDPHAVIVDTKETGHPDLAALTWAMSKGSRAEAVIVISNPKVTGNVVEELERRGVAAFGAIFDS